MVIHFMRSVDKERDKNKKKGKANMKSSQEKQRKYYRGRKTRERKEQIKSFLGQKVLLCDARRKTRKGRAMDKEWSGPHEITETVEKKHVRLNGRLTKKDIKYLTPWIFDERTRE